MEQMPAYSVIPMPQQAMLMQQQAMMGGHPQMMQARMQMQQQPQPGRSATPSSSKIFIGGLPPSIDDAELERYFGQFGTLIDSIVMKTREGKPRGFGFVKYESSSSAREVQQLAAYCVYCTLGGAYCIAYSEVHTALHTRRYILDCTLVGTYWIAHSEVHTALHTRRYILHCLLGGTYWIAHP